MKLSEMWYFFAGYVIVDVSGFGLHGFLSRLASEGVYASEVKRLSYTVVRMRVSGGAFGRLRALADDAGAEVCVVRRGGTARLAAFCCRRKLVPITAALLTAALIILAQFVWSVDIICGDDAVINEFSLYERVKESGVYIGIPRSEIAPDELERFVRNGFPEVGYVNVYFRGVSLVVEAVENVMPPEQAGEQPCDIIAETDALIERVVPLRGEPIVSEGDVVRRGDVLISGIYTAKEMDFSVAADGEITARVWLSGSAEAPIDAQTPSEAARTQAREAAYYQALAKIPENAEILSLRAYYEYEDGLVRANAVIETRQRIGVRAYR